MACIERVEKAYTQQKSSKFDLLNSSFNFRQLFILISLKHRHLTFLINQEELDLSSNAGNNVIH